MNLIHIFYNKNILNVNLKFHYALHTRKVTYFKNSKKTKEEIFNKTKKYVITYENDQKIKEVCYNNNNNIMLYELNYKNNQKNNACLYLIRDNMITREFLDIYDNFNDKSYLDNIFKIILEDDLDVLEKTAKRVYHDQENI
jgi:hypothetical protein